MSQENVEIVRRVLKTIRQRDRTAYLALHADDDEVVPIRDFPEAGVRGPEAAWDFLVEAMDSFEAVPMDEAALVDAGTGKVSVHQSPDMRGKESGAEVTWEYWLVVTVRHGRIVRTQWFVNSAEALEAAGLRE